MRPIVATLVLIAGFSLVSCNGLRIHVGKTVPPDFTFNAGRFAECCTNFRVFAVFEERAKAPLWRIVASTGVVERSEANSLTIQYGRLPDRFQQEIPIAGEPPPLVEDRRYEAVAGGTSYVPWARVGFIIKNNQIVELPAELGDNP